MRYDHRQMKINDDVRKVIWTCMILFFPCNVMTHTKYKRYEKSGKLFQNKKKESLYHNQPKIQKNIINRRTYFSEKKN